MTDREKAKHIDAFKYWCETNEESGVITLPKFLCEHIVEILDDAPTVERPHGVWKEVCDFDGNHYKWECSVCGRLEEFEEDFCNCGADMRKEGDEE